MDKLTPEEFKFVQELLDGSTVEQAGEAVGIKRRTAFEWKKKEHIKAAIAAGRQGEFKVIQEYRAERVRVVLPEISQTLQDAAPEAVKVILDIMYNGNKEDTVRLQAAKEILKLSGIIEQQQIVQSAEQTVTQKGLTEEAAAAIRSQILGIPDAK